jgi:hypothetical protein
LEQTSDEPRQQRSVEEAATAPSVLLARAPHVDTTSNFISVDGKVVPNPNNPMSGSGEAIKSGKVQAIQVVPSDAVSADSIGQAVSNPNEEINQKEKSMPEALAEYDARMEEKRVARQAAWDKRQAERKAEREKRQAVRKSRKNATKEVSAPETDDTSTAKIIGDSSANDNEPGLRVKGLYIGMGIDQASTILHELLGVTTEVKECNETEDLMCRFDRNAEVKYVIWGSGSILLVKAGGARKVSSLTFPGSVVDKLFNVSGIDAYDFAKNFSSGYNLPDMERFSNNIGRTGWEYSSPNGYKVQIYESKDLHITKLPKRSEMQFN